MVDAAVSKNAGGGAEEVGTWASIYCNPSRTDS